MFHLSCFLCSGNKQPKQVCIQILLHPHPCIILPPVMQREVQKMYSSLAHLGGTQITFEESYCTANSLRFQLDLTVLFVCKGQMFAPYPCWRRWQAAVYSEVNGTKPICKVLKRRSHLYNKKIGLTTCKNTWTNTSTLRYSLTKPHKLNFYEPSCQSCKMSSAITEKNNKCTIMRKWPNGPRQIDLICY